MQNLKQIVEDNYLGYNDNLPPQNLLPGQLVTAVNVRATDNGLTKVFGSTVIGTQIANFPFDGLTDFEILSSGNKFLVAVLDGASNASWYEWNGSGNFSAISGSNVMANGQTTYFETALNILYGLNGTDVGKWDGTTFTHNPSGFPAAYFPIWFHNYMFAARTNANPNRLAWSNLGDPTTWDAVNQIVDINPGDGDEITGVGVLNDELFAFKRNTIWSITGFSGSTFTSTTANTQNTNNHIYGYGCVAPNSIVAAGDDIYFLSFLGDTPHIRSLQKTIYATVVEGGIITHDITNTMKSMTLAAVGTCQGIYDGRYIKWAIATNGNALPDTIIELDTYNIGRSHGHEIYPFVKRTGVHPAFFALSTIGGTAKVYFADWFNTSPYAQGYVYKFDPSVYTDLTGVLGNQITMDVITRNFMPHPERKEKFKYLYMKYDTGELTSITVNGNVDNTAMELQDTISLNTSGAVGLDSFRLDNSVLGVLGGGSATGSHRVNLANMVGKMGQFEFTESSNAPVKIYDVEVEYAPKGLRNS
jgi:hypothetical protein